MPPIGPDDETANGTPTGEVDTIRSSAVYAYTRGASLLRKSQADWTSPASPAGCRPT